MYQGLTKLLIFRNWFGESEKNIRRIIKHQSYQMFHDYENPRNRKKFKQKWSYGIHA
jgi:hypothetical protein